MRLKEKLHNLCTARKWGRYDLLDVVDGVSKSTIDNWFRGKSKPNLESALRLSRAFNVPLEFLADDDLDQPPAPEIGADEQAILDLVQDLGIGRTEAVRRLAREDTLTVTEPVWHGPPIENDLTAHEVDPRTGQRVPRSRGKHGGGKRGAG